MKAAFVIRHLAKCNVYSEQQMAPIVVNISYLNILFWSH